MTIIKLSVCQNEKIRLIVQLREYGECCIENHS